MPEGDTVHTLAGLIGGYLRDRELLAGRVLIVGAGGLGSPAAMYLAAAGVGTLGIVDDDVVDIEIGFIKALPALAKFGTSELW